MPRAPARKTAKNIVENERVLVFRGGPLHNWSASPFVIQEGDDADVAEGTPFRCVEQYMMFKKALFFEDQVMAKAILAERSPFKQKHMGRMVRNFNARRWDEVCDGIVRNGIRMKMEQNEDVARLLMETGDKILGEASKKDKIWGIGLGIDDVGGVLDDGLWKGMNRLGKALMMVREMLKGRETLDGKYGTR